MRIIFELGIPDCPDLSDELKCSYCALDSLYCGRSRTCIPRSARCDGKIDWLVIVICAIMNIYLFQNVHLYEKN